METYREFLKKWLSERPNGYLDLRENVLAVSRGNEIVNKLNDQEIAALILAIQANRLKDLLT